MVALVGGACLSEGRGAEDDGFARGRGPGHLVEERDVVLAGDVGDVDGPAGDAARGAVEGGVLVHGHEHVEVRDGVEVLGEEGIVGVHEDVPRVAARDLGEEVVAVAHEDRGAVRGQLRTEDDRGRLRHAAYGFDAEMPQAGGRPGVKVRGCEACAGGGGDERVEHVLGVSFDGVYAAVGQKAVKVVVELCSVFRGDDGHFPAHGQVIGLHVFALDFYGFVVLRDLSGWRDAGPVAKKSVPDCDVLDIGMLGAEICDGVFKAIWEGGALSFKFDPALLELIR